MLQEAGGYEVVGYDKKLGAGVYRARINHFSQGALGRKLNRQCAFQTKKLWKSSELEFLNATGKRLMFLVLPTSYSDGAVTSIALRLKAQGIAGSLDVQRAIEQGILKSALDFQLVPVPAMMSAATTSLEEGQECPFSTCTLPSAAGKEAKVALVTVDNTFVYVWFNKIMKKGTELVVLPPMFGDYPEGYATRRVLADGLDFDMVDAAGMAENPAVLAISSGAGAGVGSATEADEDKKEDV